MSLAQHARSASAAPRPPCPWPWRRFPARSAGASSPAALPPLPAQVPLPGASRAARHGPGPRPVPVPLSPSRAVLGQLLSRTPTLPWAALLAPPQLSTAKIRWVTRAPEFSSFRREGRAGQRGGNAGVWSLAGRAAPSLPPPGSTPGGHRDFGTCGRLPSPGLLLGPLLEGRTGKAWFRGGGCI